MVAFLEDEAIEPAQLRAAIRACTLDLSITPVLCGSAFKNKGVQPLLDAIIDYLPSPVDVPAIQGTRPPHRARGDAGRRPEEPFAALAFKVMSDPYVGKLTYFRVYSGRLKAGSHILNATKGQQGARRPHPPDARQPARGARRDRRGRDRGRRGPQADHHRRDAVSADELPVLLEAIEFPEPVIDVAVEPKTKADQDKLATALGRLAEEDPTFRVRTDDETGQTVISGMGELHLEIIVDRLIREFGVQASVGKPQVAYRETVRRAVQKVEGRFVRQTGGRGQYGHAVISLEPTEPGNGYEFVNEIVGGVIPREYIPSVDQGIQQAMESGVLAGYPVVDVKATLTYGSYHDVDSSEMAFKIAGSMAFKNAMQKANPVLLEPVFAVEVVTPEEYMGDVIGDLNSRRGRIEGMEPRGNAQVVTARVPLSEMFGYATAMRSMTQGRATYSMQFARYEEVPKSLAEAIMAGSDDGGRAR